MLTAPPLGLMLLKTSSMPLNSPPAEAKMSKLVMTWVPLIETLKTRLPAVA